MDERNKVRCLAPTRDFSFVDDTVSGFLLGDDLAIGRVNLGSGFEISIGDCARLISTIMETDVEFVSDDQRFNLPRVR